MTNTNTPNPDPRDDEIQREYEAKQAQRQQDNEKAEGVAGTAMVGAGCLWVMLLPFSFILLVVLVVLAFGLFNGD